MTTGKAAPTAAWFRVRGYPHFDHKISESVASAYVTVPTKVATHSFYPFLSYQMITPRYKKDQGKVEDKSRPIRYAAHLDSHIFAYYANTLLGSYEKYICGKPLSKSVLAYRKLNKSNIEFADQAFNDIQSLGDCVTLCFDVTGFFDNLPHSVIKEKWGEIIGSANLPDDHYAVYKAITKFSWADRGDVYKMLSINPKGAYRIKGALCTPAVFRTDIRKKGLISRNNELKGIPQGSPISAVLSNIAMISFDERVSQFASDVGGLYRRYCDDILIACPVEHEREAIGVINDEIEKLGLSINNDKTEKTYFSQDGEGALTADTPMQYLGFKFDGKKKFLRSKTLSRYWRRLKTGVRSATKAAKAAKKRGENGQVFKQELYEKFTHLGKNNFVRYAYRASDKMNEEAIKRQLRNHWEKLQQELEKEAISAK
ncbi:antiviral reverse transcriptase Drt2 [Geomonas propionica]|uniref:Group II intron reverse transcriptase domain-containing protein n=1 Tax=Geomonas propionica TaxID=2798582 RepID=A0ABS0YMP1_9BACT|nr:antiviral reverse transcriptase Drt2 [Geomonas propionica]MBJ6799022.1 group II intron reverse transcriptase domain-containing protein [Geomonas propionica]